MSLEDLPSILTRWLKDRAGIRITQEYLAAWYADQQKPISDFEAAYRQILSDFLNKDISTSSQPVIRNEFGQTPVQTFPPGDLQQPGVVLQIQDTKDISNSTFSLLNSLQNLTTVRQTYIERQAGEEVNFPRGMLRWTLTDGTRQIQAMEMETIPELNLKTPFGCKLLIKNCQVKRGMLMLYRSSVKVLGGDIPTLYGGDMVAELERRFKAELGINQQTNQTQTTRPPVQHASTMPAQLPSANNNNNTNSTASRPLGRSETLPQNSFTMDEFDDFDDDDDMLYSAMEGMATNRPNDIDLPDSSVPQASLASDPIPTLSDDEDFVEPSFSPMRVDATRSSPSSYTNISLSKSKKPLTTPPVQEPPVKRSRYDTTEVQSSASATRQQHDNEEEEEEEEDGMDLSDLDWVNTSVWENLNNVKREGVTIDEEGRMHCTFDVMARKLKAMQHDEPSEDLADIVFVKAKCIYFTNLRLSQTQKFNLEIEVADPDNTNSETFNVIFNDHVLSELMGTSKSALLELSKQKGGQKRIMKEVFQPFQRKVMSATATLELDISVMETKASQKEPGKTVFLPVVVGYEKYD